MRVLFLFLFLVTGTAYAQDNWSSYYFPVDASMATDYQGVPAETFDSGKSVLEPPAGIHGFNAVAKRHFSFTDGTRARFWGTNLCFNASFPEYDQAEILAERIAFFGFNAVRLLHMDYSFEPDGIFEGTSGRLSANQLKKLDYFIFQLKQRGIYVDMCLLSSRSFTEADGVPAAALLGRGAKGTAIFDPTLITLQKQYALDLLTHLNPYTKMRYCDDPAIALVEINDDNTLAGFKPSTLPEYYKKEYNEMLDIWLSEANRRDAYEGSQLSLTPEIRSWEMEKHAKTSMLKTLGQNEVILYVDKVTPTPWHLQFCVGGVRLAKDFEYVLKFSAKAGHPLTIGAETQQHFPPWQNLGLNRNFDLTDKFQTFEVPFTATEDCDNAKVGFIVGFETGDITIKDVSLHENVLAAEIRDFNYSLEKKYLNQMRAYLRDDVGVKVPIGIGASANPAQLSLQEECLDYVDHRAFWDLPALPDKPTDMGDFRILDKSIFTNPNRGILSIIAGPKGGAKQSPWTVSEWSHCYPNQFAYETPLLLAEKARQNDWDALFQFVFTSGHGAEKTYDDIHSFFDINANAQQLMLCSFAGRLFLNNDKRPPFTFGITKKCAILKFGNQTIKVGSIKNTDSGWTPEGKFNWGTAPTLLSNN